MQQTFLKNNDCNHFFVSFFYQFKQRIILTVKILKAFNLLSKHTALLGFAKSLAKIFKTINYLKFIQISYLEKIDELFREIKKAPEGAFFIVSLVIPTKQFKEIRNVSNN